MRGGETTRRGGARVVPLANRFCRFAAASVVACAIGLILPRNTGAESVTLTWTAPGDNGLSGRATSYQVRLSTVAPGSDTLAWWAAAGAVAGVPPPRSAGSAETLVVAGLPVSQERFFAVRALDETGNIAGVSNVARATPVADTSGSPPDSSAPPDTLPPLLTSVSVSGLTHSSATIAWETDEAADARVVYGLGAGLSLVAPIDTLLVLSHSITLSGLLADTTYAFQPSSRDSSGNSGLAGPFSFRTLEPPDTMPPVVSGLSVTAVTQSGAQFSWETNEPADAWVEYGTSASYGEIAPSGDSLGTSHEALLSDLSPNTEYHARVVAVDASGNRDETVDLAFLTAPDAGLPPDAVAPTISAVLATVESASKVRITWTTNEVSTGEVAYHPFGESGAASAPDSAHGTSHAVLLSGLAQQTRFVFSVVARDTAGNLAVAGPTEFETPSSLDRVAPVVSGVEIDASSPTVAVVRWRTDEPADSQLEYGPTSTLGLATPLDDSLRVEHAVALGGLDPGTSYVVRVLSRDGSGNLTRSAEAGFTTGEAPAPADSIPPTIAAVVASVLGPSAVRITWETDEPADAQVAYGLGADRGSLSARDARLLLAHEIVINGLSDGSAWSFSVLSQDSAGNRAESEPSVFETPSAADTTRPAISGLVVLAVTSAAAEVRWTTDEPSDQQVEYGETEEYGLATPLDESFSGSHVVRIAGLYPATLYHVRVLSRDSSGNLARSSDVAFETASIGGAPGDTVPPIATDLSIEAIDPTQVRVRWMTNEPSDGQVEYGLSNSYGSLSRSEGASLTSHEIVLEGLAPGTVFHCRALSRDTEGNLGLSEDVTFETELDKTPPAVLAALTAEPASGGLLLTWQASDAADLAGYRVYKSDGAGYAPVTEELISETTLLDVEISNPAAGEVRYAVAAVDRSGNESAWAVASVSLGLELLPARPNPANPWTMLRFRIPPVEAGAESRVVLAIYDIEGALVKSLIEGNLPRGEHEARWDGGNWRGDPVASGTYFARLSTGTGTSVRKLTVLR